MDASSSVQREHDPLQQVDIFHVERPLRRGTQVVELEVQPGPPQEFVRASADPLPGFLAERDVVLRVAAAPVATATVLLETLARVLPQRLQQLVAHRAVGLLLGDDHRLAHEPVDRVEHRPLVDRVVGDDRARRPGVERAGEHGQPCEHHRLVRLQQRVRPVDRGAQGLVALQRHAPAAGEEPEPLVEQGQDLGHAERRDARRRQHDRERNAVEATTQLVDRRRVRGVDAKSSRTARARSSKRRTASLCTMRSTSLESASDMRTQRGDVLAVDIETLPAGREDAHVRARSATHGRRAGQPARSGARSCR